MPDKTKHILQLNDITKIYPGVVALNKVSLDVRPGEIHALVGENGAGKSTLIKTCSGAVVPEQGQVVIRGREFRPMTPKLAEENGIAVIYQEFNLIGELSVAENIFLGRAPRKGIVIDTPAMVRETEKIFRQFGLSIDPNGQVKNLSVGYQQIVEIAKAIALNAQILIMDEPTAPLPEGEVDHLFKIVAQLKAAGVTIIYISHRMDEIFRLSDRVTVLRDGEKIATMDTAETNVAELVELMVGRSLSETFPARSPSVSDEIILEARNLSGNGVSDINFKLRKGEVLGFAGLIGAGRTELAELIFGYRPIESGQIIYKGEVFSPSTPRQAIDKGIALVPEDRKKLGALLDFDIKENISIAIVKRLSHFFMINRKAESDTAEQYRKSIRIKAPTINEKVRNLSGGNQQKVIVAKWLASEADLIIFDEPTRGIDVGAKYEIYKLINKLVEEGKTIIMISSEMEEVLGMSDRIIVLAEGRLTGIVEKVNFSQETVMGLASID
jgi:ribose transport system ATP-binding protein